MTDEKERKYESKIEFTREGLRLEISYERELSQKEYENLIDIYQHRFSQKVGRPIPREEIQVSPKAGELFGEQTTALVRLRVPVYAGLIPLNKRAPYILPRLIEDLHVYRDRHQLDKQQQALIEHAVKGLQKIISGEDKRVVETAD